MVRETFNNRKVRAVVADAEDGPSALEAIRDRLPRAAARRRGILSRDLEGWWVGGPACFVEAAFPCDAGVAFGGAGALSGGHHQGAPRG